MTGYFSFLYGTEGVERQYNDVLAGRTDGQRLQGLLGFLDERPNVGNVTLTLRADIQAVAQQALAGRTGSVVALDPRTGAILAMYSNPSYDPNPLAGHDFDAVEAARQALLAAPGNPLLVKPYQERYLPGSSFKVITTTAGLDTGTVTPETVYPPTSEYLPPGTTDPIENYGGTVCGGDLLEVFRRSCNTAFAQMGVDVGCRGHGAHGRGLRLQPHAADRHAAAGPELVPVGRGLPLRHPQAGPGELRPERQPDHAVEPGAGVGGGGQPAA